MRRRVQSIPLEEPSVNLTPLIDIVFVVLIMFILIAPLLEKEEIELAQGSSVSASSVDSSGTLSIHVLEDDTICVGGEVVEISALTERLLLEKGKEHQGSPMLYQDKRAHFGTFQEVKNSLEKAGFDKMDLILNPS